MLKWLRRMFRPDERPPETLVPDTAETTYTRPATWEDVMHVARLLNEQCVRYLLVGGYALAAHGYVRMTQDVGIAVAPDEENARRRIAALAQLPDGAAATMAGESDPFQGDRLGTDPDRGVQLYTS